MASSCFSQLPEDLWQRVLQLVPLRQRLGACSLVEQKWRRAAAAATDTVSLSPYFNIPSGFQQWLASPYGQHVTSLKQSHPSQPFTQACPNLRALDLSDCRVHQSALRGCTGLTSCSLSSCRLHQAEEPFDDALAALGSLKHLVLVHYRAAAGAFLAPGSDTRLSFSGTVLQRLTQLAHLCLGWVKPEPLHQVSVLQHLQVLDVSGDGLDISATSTPGFSSLTALQRLEVGCNAALDPAALHASTQLQDLVLADGCRILAPAAGGGSSSGGGLSLLQLLPTLQNLSRLEVWDVVCEWPAADTAAAAQYSALVASPRLQQLELVTRNLGGFLPFAFSPGRQLTCLTKLSLVGWGQDDDWEPSSSSGGAVSQAQLGCLVRACPQLQALDVFVQPTVHFARLAGLSLLTRLCVYNLEGPSCATLTPLSHLELRHLDLNFHRPVRVELAVSLTCLQHVTFLRVNQAYAHNWVEELFCVAKPGNACWLQLLEQCATADECRAGIVRGLGTKLLQLRRDTEFQVAGLQGQVAQLQQRDAERRQVAEEQQSQVETQGARLGDLEEQVQLLLQALQHSNLKV